jgi:hypothetical protein
MNAFFEHHFFPSLYHVMKYDKLSQKQIYPCFGMECANINCQFKAKRKTVSYKKKSHTDSCIIPTLKEISMFLFHYHLSTACYQGY